MSKTVTIRGDEWSEDELRDLAARPRLDVPVKDEYGRRARLAVHVWQAQHGEGEQPDEAAEEEPPAPSAKPAPTAKTAEPEAPYIYAHPCPRCGDPVKGRRKDKLCDACRATSKREQVAKCRAKAKAKTVEGDDGNAAIIGALALTAGSLGRHLQHTIYMGDAKAYRSTVDALADLDRIIAAAGGWKNKEDK